RRQVRWSFVEVLEGLRFRDDPIEASSGSRYDRERTTSSSSGTTSGPPMLTGLGSLGASNMLHVTPEATEVFTSADLELVGLRNPLRKTQRNYGERIYPPAATENSDHIAHFVAGANASASSGWAAVCTTEPPIDSRCGIWPRSVCCGISVSFAATLRGLPSR